MTRLFAGSIRTYLQAEEESGQEVGFQETGSLRLASTERELELFYSYAKLYETLNLDYEVVSPQRTAELHPLLDISKIFGAAHTPTDGHVDPTGATQALAKSARALGAVIERYRPVNSIRKVGADWLLETEKGVVTANHVVVATSFWAREMLEPLGINVPLYATEHHEIVTEPIEEISARENRLPAVRDSYCSCNIRQEGKGLLVGVYETHPEFWGLEGIPTDFKEELLPSNIDRLMDHLEKLIERLPAFESAGIKVSNNGPLCFTPNGLPMLGPIGDEEGLWLASGFNVGIGTGGGSGEFLAHWMTTGEPPFDLKAVHADRYGNQMTKEEALSAIRSVYARGYQLPDHI